MRKQNRRPARWAISINPAGCDREKVFLFFLDLASGQRRKSRLLFSWYILLNCDNMALIPQRHERARRASLRHLGLRAEASKGHWHRWFAAWLLGRVCGHEGPFHFAELATTPKQEVSPTCSQQLPSHGRRFSMRSSRLCSN